MSEAWIEIDGVPERELPAHARDGRTGDRVSLLDAGLLHVVGGRATFVRWSDVLGVIEQPSRAIVLVPRRPPAAPWIEVDADLLGGDRGGVAAFVRRLGEHGQSGGYRDAVRRRRQGMSPNELRDRVAAREPIPGALEVPSTTMLGVSYPGLGCVQLLTLAFFCVLTGVLPTSVVHAIFQPSPDRTVPYSLATPLVCVLFGACVVLAIWIAARNREIRRSRSLAFIVGAGYVLTFGTLLAIIVSTPPERMGFAVAMLLFYLLVAICIVAGAWTTVKIAKIWRERKNRTLPRQRVLVLAPDGCVVGFRSGVRVLAWPEIGRFRVAPSPVTYEDALVVTDAAGNVLGDIEASWLDAPLPLVAQVAEAYRQAAATA